MLRLCANFLAIGGLALSLGAANGGAMAANLDGELPIQTVTITVAEDARDQFFNQLREYADTSAFAIRIARSRADAPSFLIQMWREDVKGIGTNATNPCTFRIGFYQNGKEQVSADIVEDLVDRLEVAFDNVQGVTVLEANATQR